jgi:hypothetical protein
MNRLSILAAGLVLAASSTASAQVSVRAPFVHVEVGPGGTYVRAPFVRYYAGPPLYVSPTPVVVTPGVVAPPGITIAPPLTVPQVIQGEPPVAAPAQGPAAAPAPAMPRKMPNGVPPPPAPGLGNNANFVPPPPAKAVQSMSLEAFAKSFQAKEGSYQIDLINPVSKMPTTVRFTLPPGQPDVAVGPASITYRYVGRTMVKIEFDADGVTVTSR